MVNKTTTKEVPVGVMLQDVFAAILSLAKPCTPEMAMGEFPYLMAYIEAVIEESVKFATQLTVLSQEFEQFGPALEEEGRDIVEMFRDRYSNEVGQIMMGASPEKVINEKMISDLARVGEIMTLYVEALAAAVELEASQVSEKAERQSATA